MKIRVRPDRVTLAVLSWAAVLAVSLLLASPSLQLSGPLRPGEWGVLAAFCMLFVVQLWVWRDEPVVPSGARRPGGKRRRSERAFWWITAVATLLIAVVGAGLCLAAASRSPVLAALIAAATCVLLRLVIVAPTAGPGLRGSRSEENYLAAVLTTSFLLPLLLLVLARWLVGGGTASWNDDATDRVVGVALSALGVLGTARYMKLHRQDIDLGPGRKSEENAWIAYTTILVLFFSTLYSIFAVLSGSGRLASLDPQGAVAIPHVARVAGAGSIALVIAVLGALAAKPTPSTPGQAPSFRNADVRLSPLVTSVTVTALTLWATAPWISLLADRGVSLKSTAFPTTLSAALFLVFALVISGWIGYTSADSIYANVAGIELLRFSTSAWIAAALAGITTASTALWLYVDAFFSISAPPRIDSLALATSLVSIGNLAILSFITVAFARSWPRRNGPFRYMALHHPTTHVFNDHFLQTAFLFITMTSVYAAWRVLDWLSLPRTVGEWVAVAGAVALPFTVASAFERALSRGTKQHLESERKRVELKRADAIGIRAGGNLCAAKNLNGERLVRIQRRFRRVQILSKFLALYIPAALAWLWRQFLPRSQNDADDSFPVS